MNPIDAAIPVALPELPAVAAGHTGADLTQVARAVLMACPAVAAHAKTRQVLGIFQTQPDLISLTVVEEATEVPIGVINKAIFMSTLARPFYQEIYLDRSCLVFMDKNPLVIEAGVPLHEVSILIAGAGEKVLADGFVIVCDGCYAGMGRAQDVLRMMVDIHEWQSRHLAVHRDRLEALVQSRTQSLVEARDAAEAGARAKASFLANMSHEIRTPMNAIIGLTHLMTEDGLPEKQMHRLSKIDHAARLLLAIVNDILDISKIGAGQLKLAHEPVDLNGVMSSVASVAAPLAHERKLSIVLEAAPFPAASLLGDGTRLTQALLNYVSNAIKFTEAGGVTVRCRRLHDDGATVLVRFEVQDTGIGLEQATLDRLFTAFRQADDSITRRYGGTGLGLAITRNLAELMGGEAGAESQPGVGSLFWFTARLARPPLAVAPAAPLGGGKVAPATLAAELRRRFSGARILVVDDDPLNREIAVDILANAGLSALTAGDGEEALRQLACGRFDLVLMDMRMPNMDGVTATAEIRRLPYGQGLPIVALTGNAFSDDREHCLQAGMDDFLPKPFNPADLYATILRWLDMRQQRAERAGQH